MSMVSTVTGTNPNFVAVYKFLTPVLNFCKSHLILGRTRIWFVYLCTMIFSFRLHSNTLACATLCFFCGRSSTGEKAEKPSKIVKGGSSHVAELCERKNDKADMKNLR